MVPKTFSVFPVKDKKPLVDWKEFSTRQATEQERTQWETEFPNAQLGIATGPVSKTFVLDDDGGLDLSKYPLPRTLMQKTPRGGKHYFFRWTEELDKKVTTKIGVLDKVDVRGQGGFAVFYGFTTPYGATPMALPPKWLVDLLPNREEKVEASVATDNWMLSQLNAVTPGTGNTGRTPTFIRVIGWLKAKGIDASVVKAVLEPWAVKYEYLKLDSLIADQYKRYPMTATDSQGSREDVDIVDFLTNIAPTKWIVPQMLAESSIVMIGGLGGSYKTWIVNDLALALASGGLWLGKFQCPIMKVLMVNQERATPEVQRRFLALLEGRGLQKEDIRDTFLLKNNSTIKINLEDSFKAFRRYLIEKTPRVVLVDSFQTFHSLNEESRGEMQFVFEKLKLLRDELGVAFIFIDHENKSAFKNNRQGDNAEQIVSHDKLAGSAVKSEVPEAIYIVRKEMEDTSIVHLTKGNNGEQIAPFLVKIENLKEDKSSISVKSY